MGVDAVSITRRSSAHKASITSAVVTAVGSAATLIVLWQPWASCAEAIDDGTAGCPVAGTQWTVQVAAMVLLGAGALSFVMSAAAVAVGDGRTSRVLSR